MSTAYYLRPYKCILCFKYISIYSLKSIPSFIVITISTCSIQMHLCNLILLHCAKHLQLVILCYFIYSIKSFLKFFNNILTIIIHILTYAKMFTVHIFHIFPLSFAFSINSLTYFILILSIVQLYSYPSVSEAYMIAVFPYHGQTRQD